MPSAKRYSDLIAKLREASLAFVAAEHDPARLAIGSTALQAVIFYLSKDSEVLDGQLTRPLAVVENAIHDTGRGAKPAVLFEPKRPAPPPPEEKKHLPTKPSRTTRENVQGALACALELSIAGKRGTDLAARRIATNARKFNVSAADGSPITAKQIKQWRTDISRRKASAEARETFEGMRQIPNHAALLRGAPVDGMTLREDVLVDPAEKRKSCEAVALGIVKGLAGTMPRSAPKRISPR